MGETLDTRSIDADSGTVHDDVDCVICGYNLRTLRADAVCPECFSPVIQSLRPDHLRLADVAWLRRMSRGVSCLLTGTLGLLAFPILVLWVSWRPGMWPVGPTAMGLTALVCWLLSVIGVFRINTSEPAARPEASSRAPRTAARLLALFSALAFVMLMFPSPGPLRRAWIVAFVPLALLVSFALSLVSLRRLARRARRPGMVRLSTVLLWLMIGGCAATACSTVVYWLLFRQAMSRAAGLSMATATTGTSAPAASATTAPAALAGLGYVGTANSPAATTTAPAMIVVPTISPVLQAVSTVAMCVTWPLLLACYGLGVVVLFKYRGMFRSTISQSRSASPSLQPMASTPLPR